MTMKSLQLLEYGEIDKCLVFNEIDKPIVRFQDVLIEVKAAAINPIDKSIIAGNLRALLPIPLPATLGYDVSGVVVEKGADAAGFEIGDLVYARVPQEQMGTLAEFVAVAAESVSKKPANISFEEAAGLPLVGLTALQSLSHVGIKEHDEILIHAGSGGVGSFAIQYAKSKGAYVYTTTSAANVAWVKELGADRVIDYTNEDYKTIVSEVDCVFDTLGKHFTLDAFDVLKTGGKIVSVAGPLDERSAQMFGMTDYRLPEDFVARCAEKKAAYAFIFMHPNGAHLNEITELVEGNVIKPVVDRVYPFSKVVDAFGHLASGRAKGKIIVQL